MNLTGSVTAGELKTELDLLYQDRSVGTRTQAPGLMLRTFWPSLRRLLVVGSPQLTKRSQVSVLTARPARTTPHQNLLTRRQRLYLGRCPDTIVWSMQFCNFVLFCPLKASRHPYPHNYRQTPLSAIRRQPTDFLTIQRISACSYLLRRISDVHYPPPRVILSIAKSFVRHPKSSISFDQPIGRI